VNGRRTREPPSRVECVGSNRATGGRPSEGREGCAQSSSSTREGGSKRDHDFSTMPTVPNSDPRRWCNTREQSHGATTSTITRDCDRPIDERKGLPTVQNAKRGREASAEKGGRRAKRPLETRIPGPKNMIREVRWEGVGAAHRECRYSSLRVREWMLTMNSHGVEISIAGCVEEMVCDPNPIPFFFFFSFFFILRSLFLGTRSFV